MRHEFFLQRCTMEMATISIRRGYPKIVSWQLRSKIHDLCTIAKLKKTQQCWKNIDNVNGKLFSHRIGLGLYLVIIICEPSFWAINNVQLTQLNHVDWQNEAKNKINVFFIVDRNVGGRFLIYWRDLICLYMQLFPKQNISYRLFLFFNRLS